MELNREVQSGVGRPSSTKREEANRVQRSSTRTVSRTPSHGSQARRGFASRGYQKVFREYHNVAEEALDKDEIPGGYRFYVRRYFQLIRPREEQ